MKKFLLLTLLAATIQLVQAQDYKKVQTNYLIGKFEDAKTEIDKVMADPKGPGKAESWYWKSKVYAAIYQNPVLRAKFPTIVKDAEAAFTKYQEMEPGLELAKKNGPEGYFDMYKTSFGEAIKFFNAKNWLEAADNFLISVTYSDKIFSNKWTSSTQPYDTTSILYLGYAYQNGNKPAEAIKAYGRLADYKTGGETYMDIYKYLVDYYTKNKNEELFKKYLGIAKELYPKESWDDFEMEYLDRNYTLAEKTAIYDKEDAAGNLSEVKYLQFGDLFVNVKNKEKDLDSLQHLKYTLKAADAFKKAYAKNSQNAIAAFNVGVIYYNIYGEYDDKYAANIRTLQGINANRPPADKDPKKKAAADAKFKEQTDGLKKLNADIEKPLMDNLDLSIYWIQKTFSLLKDKTDRNKIEKSVINKSVDFLANLYAYKRDKVRGKDIKAYDLYDAEYKSYDSLHGIGDKNLISKKNISQVNGNINDATGFSQIENSPNIKNNFSNSSYQISNRKVIIKAKMNQSGTFTVQAKINGFGPFNFICDNGASVVSISKSEFITLWKQGNILSEDILGNSRYSLADGSIEVGTDFIIKRLEFGDGGLVATNVKATVSNNVSAPLLLGQSFFQKFGKVTQNNTLSQIEVEQ